ncbi:PREDICTED: uncharacterized protein LOC102028242 isoform X1 [Chinchilla lanigera]|uniref:uncharacterized protein LOC102028242 isoform X1 n=1 Tax=Chinchilla lanigera TaxID=34839 RepID=UPI000695FE6D|nr:PREDICTED: uncharacterized protein LOC102028242 isoform X1 [Chinchilla lanigera]
MTWPCLARVRAGCLVRLAPAPGSDGHFSAKFEVLPSQPLCVAHRGAPECGSRDGPTLLQLTVCVRHWAKAGCPVPPRITPLPYAAATRHLLLRDLGMPGLEAPLPGCPGPSWRDLCEVSRRLGVTGELLFLSLSLDPCQLWSPGKDIGGPGGGRLRREPGGQGQRAAEERVQGQGSQPPPGALSVTLAPLQRQRDPSRLSPWTQVRADCAVWLLEEAVTGPCRNRASPCLMALHARSLLCVHFSPGSVSGRLSFPKASESCFPPSLLSVRTQGVTPHRSQLWGLPGADPPCPSQGDASCQPPSRDRSPDS